MKVSDHLSHAQLIALLDGEASANEGNSIRVHLRSCEMCHRKQVEFAQLSSAVERVVNGVPVESSAAGRANLVSALAAAGPGQTATHDAAKVMLRFGWAMALAASLAIALLFVPARNTGVQTASPHIAKSSISSLDVNGETFVALPYSDPNLPLNAPRIVEMQVPISSLLAAGIVLEPGLNDVSDRTVRANVLLGIDGQPLGLHVLGAE